MPRRRSRNDQAIRATLYKWVESAIEEVIYYNWLHGNANSSVAVGSFDESGATDALFFQAEIQAKLVVKFHLEDAQKEEGGYEVLSEGPEEFTKHLVPPIHLADGRAPIWVAPLLDADTLHKLAYRSNTSSTYNRWIKEVYQEFLKKTKSLWISTKTPMSADLLNDIYVERIWGRMRDMERGLRIHDFASTNMVVNKTEYDTVENLMGSLADNIKNANVHFACTTHGDEHAKNIMVYKEAISRDPTGWVIIDYVNAKKQSDWLFSIAKMLQWWEFYCALEQAKLDSNLQQALETNWELKDGRLIITYNEGALQKQVHPRCRDLQQMIYTFAQSVADDFEEDAQAWRHRLELALFSVIFASVPRHFEKAGFAVPIMIGESLKHLNKALA